MNETTRDEVRQVLLSWQAGHLSPREVHEWADDRYPTQGTVQDDLVVEILVCDALMRYSSTTRG